VTTGRAAPEPEFPANERLERVLSLRHFVAMGINVGIGGSIYLIGSGIYRLSGTWSLVLAAAVGAFSLIVSLVMADVSSRFESTGGCYVQTRAAFGPFCGFEIAWMLWFTRVTAQASLTNGIATSVGYFFGGTLPAGARIVCIVVVTLGIGLLHLRRVRFGARIMLSFAVFKLLPLGIVLSASAYLGFIRPVPISSPPGASDCITVALLLLFSLTGFEIIAVPAGEGRNPRRDVPLATILSIGIVLIIWMLLHLTLINTVPNLGAEARPVAVSAERLMGPAMGVVVNLGAIVSAVGTCIAIHLAASRSLYAVAADNLVPKWFSAVHPVQRVPHNAILFSTAAVLLLSFSGSFEFLAVGAAIPRLLIFFSIAAALIRFRHSPSIRNTVPPSAFVLPFGSVLAALVMLVCVIIFAMASLPQCSFTAAGVLLGALLYAGNARNRSLASAYGGLEP
jgi:basic amino acid/polyamine antiporter, APA family